MTVYVDDMKASVGRMIMCHMIADTEAELHAMADRIGIARKWYQGDHYDICKSMRQKAVKAGACEVTMRQAALMLATWKQTGVMPAPDDAFEAWKAMRPNRPAAEALEKSE